MKHGAAQRDIERFDAWAATYDRSPAQALLFPRIHTAVFRELLRHHPTVVVDVGCGTGALALAIARRLPAAQVTGVDPAPRMIDEASRKAPSLQRLRFVTAPATALPLSDACADVVVSTMSFHHWDNREAALREVRRVLRPEGRALIADIFARGLLQPILRRAGHGQGYATDRELRAMLTASDLRLATFHGIVPFSAPLAVAEIVTR